MVNFALTTLGKTMIKHSYDTSEFSQLVSGTEAGRHVAANTYPSLKIDFWDVLKA